MDSLRCSELRVWGHTEHGRTALPLRLGGKENNTRVGKQRALSPIYLLWALILLEDTPPPCAARRSRNSSNN